MNNPIQLDSNTIYLFLKKCDNLFKPKLSSLINLHEYAEKLSKKSVQLCHYIDDNLVGMLAIYVYDYSKKTSFISCLSVLENFQKRGLGEQLLLDAIKYADDQGFKKVKLEVYKLNSKAINLYKKLGFKIDKENKDSVVVVLDV